MALKVARLPGVEFRARGYKTIPSRLFLLKVKKTDLSKARIGVVAGKSVHKSAAKRNFWRRQVREGLAAAMKPGMDALVMLSPAITKVTKKEFHDELVKAIGKMQ